MRLTKTERTAKAVATCRIREADGFRVDEARIVKTDIRAASGVLHAIDTVLLPR